MLPNQFLDSFTKRSEAMLLKQNKTNNYKIGVFAKTAMMPLFITLIYTKKLQTKSSVRFRKGY